VAIQGYWLDNVKNKSANTRNHSPCDISAYCPGHQVKMLLCVCKLGAQSTKVPCYLYWGSIIALQQEIAQLLLVEMSCMREYECEGTESEQSLNEDPHLLLSSFVFRLAGRT